MAGKQKCPKCGFDFDLTKSRCPSCRSWVTESQLDGFGSVLLEDITSANVDRIQTGPWDICFGENDNGEVGVVRGSTNLIAGAPGGGKSTMLLQSCANIVEAYEDMNALYLSAEEQLPQIKARADRLQINGKRRIRFVDLRKGNADLLAVLKAYKFGILIVDSLKAIAPDEEGRVQVCKMVKDMGVDLHAPVIISHHINKGDDIAGLMALQHEVDCTMTLIPDPTRRYRGEAVRVLSVRKNRNGPAWIESELGMTGRGLVPLAEIADAIEYTEDEEDDDGSFGETEEPSDD